MGIGDAIEYASAIKAISNSNMFEKVAVAFVEDYRFLFENHFNLKNNFQYVINKKDLEEEEDVFDKAEDLATEYEGEDPKTFK